MVSRTGGLGFSDDLVDERIDLGLGKGLREVREENLELLFLLLHQVLPLSLAEESNGFLPLLDEGRDGFLHLGL